MITDTYVINRIEELCKKYNYSHYRLSLKSGVHQSSLSTLLNRKSTPNVFTLDKICKGFGITLAEFFADDDKIVNLSEEENYFINMWMSLNDMQKQLVMAYMQGIIDTKNINK